MELFVHKSNKTDTLNFSKKTTNNYFEIFYFNEDISYIIIKTFKAKKLVNINRINLEESQVEKGVITNYNEVVNYIYEFITNNKNEKGKLEKYFIDLKICSSSIFKTTISLPKISFFKATKLKLKELRDGFEKYGKNYSLIEDKYNYDLGVVYNEYFLKNTIIKNWKEIANITNTKLSSIQLFQGFLFDSMKNESNYNFEFKLDEEDISKDLSKLSNYALIYTKEGISTFILVNDHQLINAYSFKYKNIDDILKKFILTISKYEFEFSKRKIEDIFIESDIDLNISKFIKKVKVHNIHFNWDDIVIEEEPEINVNKIEESIKTNDEAKEDINE